MASRRLLLALALAITCSAQTTDHTCDSASRLLHSASLNDKAWGAYLAASCDLQNLAPEIGDELVRANPEQLARLPWDSEGFWAAHAMIDALVRLKYPLSPGTIKEIARGFRVEAVILMLQNARENIENLTGIRNRDPRAYESIAATNALVNPHAPRLAGSLLKELSFNNWVWVSDDGVTTAGGIAGSLLGGNGTLKVPDDLPPTGVYRITSHPSPRDEMIADGGVRMYAHRAQFETGTESAFEQPAEGYCYQCLRTEWIAKLAGLSMEEATNLTDRNTPIRWTNASAMRAEIQRSIDLQVNGLKRVARLLIAAKLLKVEEIAAPFSIEVHIQDSRKNTATSLPELQPVPFHLD